MQKTTLLSITLPHEMAKLIKDKVRSGTYATESEVVSDGLRALQTQDAAVEEWLRTDGVARYDAFHRAPDGRPASAVFASLRDHHARSAKKRDKSQSSR
jgi:antitoxin ParD1/3/4